MTTFTLHRPLPVVHHLRHSGCYTAGVCFAATTARAEVPIRIVLIPRGLDQRANDNRCLNGTRSFAQILPLLGCFLAGFYAVGFNLLDELVVLAHPTLDVHGQVVRAEMTGLRVSENRRNHIVSSYDHPALTVLVLIHIEQILFRGCLAYHLLLRYCFLSTRRRSDVHKVICHERCVIRRDALCKQCH